MPETRDMTVYVELSAEAKALLVEIRRLRRAWNTAQKRWKKQRRTPAREVVK